MYSKAFIGKPDLNETHILPCLGVTNY